MKRLFLLSALILIILSSCIEQDLGKPNEISNTDRVNIKNEFLPIDFGTEKSGNANQNYVFTHIASVEPPVVDNITLQSTHFYLNENMLYVSYNNKGSNNKGVIDVIDVSQKDNPVIVYSYVFNDKDINTVAVYNNKIFFGGQDGNGALWGYIDDNNIYYEQLPSFSTTHSYEHDNMLYFTSGDNNGALTIMDNDLNIVHHNINDPRSVTVSNNNIFVLTKEDVFILDDNFIGLSLLDNTWIQEGSKAVIDSDNNMLFVATNRGGLKIYDNQNYNMIQSFDRPLTPDGLDDEDFVTNGVSFNELLFVADGGAGIWVGELNSQKNNTFNKVGYFDFGGPLSSNLVESDGDYIFVASGLGGVEIIGFENSGLPDDLEPGIVCETLKDSIISMFPERDNAIESHPEFFDGSKDLNIITNSETEVWIQFVWEGAGWKNTFGYYTYEVGNEPQSVNDITKHVIFPNVSGVNEGGGLLSGDMVNLGVFPENTVIGFYLTAKGWDNGLVDGLYTHYTDINLNLNNNQQHILFMENCCDELVLTFEDVRLPGGDKDFNDIILTIKDNNVGIVNDNNSFKIDNLNMIQTCE